MSAGLTGQPAAAVAAASHDGSELHCFASTAPPASPQRWPQPPACSLLVSLRDQARFPAVTAADVDSLLAALLHLQEFGMRGKHLPQTMRARLEALPPHIRRPP